MDADIVEMIDHYKAVMSRLQSIEEKIDDLRSQIDAQSNTGSPWVFKLVMELNLGADEDGNGLIFGRDFGLAENANHVPPSLQPMVGLMRQQGWSGRTLSWEQYLATLPDGDHKSEVERFVNALPERHVRPREKEE